MLQTAIRRVLGRPQPRPPDAVPHLPEAHAIAGEQLRVAADLARLKQSPTWKRIEAEAALRQYEYERAGERRAQHR